MLTPYNHLLGYLHRWKVISIGRLMVRIHHILTPDTTPFFHNHPFRYVSVILSGGYTEQVLDGDAIVTKHHQRFGIILRSNRTYHRIVDIQPNTKTLFFALRASSNGQGWNVKRHPEVPNPPLYVDYPDGVYKHGDGFRSRKNGVWFALRETPILAEQCDRISLHQHILPENVHALDSTRQPV